MSQTMKQATGYITEDGTFFESELEAELYEAELALRAAIPDTDDVERFFILVRGTRREIGRYLDAYNTAYHSAERNKSAQEPERDEDEVRPASGPVGSQGFVSGTEEDLESLLKLPVRRPSHMPDVGGSSRTEEVPNRRKVDGA